MSIQLSDFLKESESTYSDNDELWKLYVIDHIHLIKAKSYNLEINNDLLARFRYNFDRLIKHLHITEDVKWIFLLINDLEGDCILSFDYISQGPVWWFIPIIEYIDQLHREYIQTNQTDQLITTWDL